MNNHRQDMHGKYTKRSLVLFGMALLAFFIGFDWVPRYCGYGGCSDQYAYWWQVFFLAFG